VSGVDDSSIVSLTYEEVRQMGSSEADADEFCNSIAAILVLAGTETARRSSSN
ncbi:hypothetical protein FRC11_006374, partial [Ceratobasidium sp. 423]